MWPQPPVLLVDELDLRALADEVGEVPRRPVELLAVGAGRGAHDLAVDEQVDRGLGRARQRRLVRERELVGVDVAPAARVLVDDVDVGGLALQLGDVPVGPVERLALLSGGAAHDLPVDDEGHRGGRVAGVARVGMAAAPDQEVDVVAGDLEVRRGDVAGAVVVVDERVDQLLALVAADRLLVADRPVRCRRARERAGGGPARPVPVRRPRSRRTRSRREPGRRWWPGRAGGCRRRRGSSGTGG